MSTLVTGGAGFIGSHLVEELAKSGEEIIVFDNFSIGTFNLPLLRQLSNVKILNGDITDWDKLNKVVAKSSKIYHLAAMNRAQRSIENPRLSNEVNITGTINVLEAARKHNIEGIVFASSSSVYGRSTAFPRRENGETIPAHPYAVGKLASEYYCDVFHHLYGMKIKILRYFAVYGPRQSPKLKYAAVIPIFIRNVIKRNPVTIYGDGTQTRNFTYVKDNVKATMIAMKSNIVDGKILNIAGLKKISLIELVEILETISGYSIEIGYDNWRLGDAKCAEPDLEFLTNKLGFVPETSIQQGLKITYEWYKKNPKYFQL